ncbi:hypothetical protein YC2023_066234 [Brassica napus]
MDAQSLRSDRAWLGLGRYVATKLCACLVAVYRSSLACPRSDFHTRACPRPIWIHVCCLRTIASSATDQAQVPWKGAPERVRALSCPDPVAPRGAVYESGCLGMQPQSGGKRLGAGDSSRSDAEWSNPRHRCLNRGLQHTPHSVPRHLRAQGFECEHACRDPKDGELCLSGAKPEETLVKADSDTDVQIVRLTWDGVAALLSHPTESRAPSGPILESRTADSG